MNRKRLIASLIKRSISWTEQSSLEHDFSIVSSFPAEGFVYYFTYAGHPFPGPAQFHRYL